MSFAKRFTHWWSSWSLVQQYSIAGTTVLLCGMSIIGSWVANEIEGAVIQNSAASTALYMDSVIAPLTQELATSKTLSESNILALDRLLIGTDLGKRIISAKIWKEGGVVVYSTQKSTIGRTYPPTPNLKRSWKGVITAEFDSLEDEEDELERLAGLPFLEMYIPIREKLTGRIVAVGEFYEQATDFKRDLFNAQLGSWVVVGFVTLAMAGLLWGIILRGSLTIQNQRQSLEERVIQLSDLRDRLQQSSGLATELHERFMRRIGSDLHDGPAQLIGLAMLRLHSLDTHGKTESTAHTTPGEWDDREVVIGALEDALSEIRNVSAGLVLPEYETQSLEEGLAKIISIHEQRTNTVVCRKFKDLPRDVNKSTKISLYRLVQETLHNAFRYAKDAPVTVSVYYDGVVIETVVSDDGPGFDPSASSGLNTGIGLPGLRERIESIGGTFEVRSAVGAGTSIIARFAATDLS